MRFSPCKGALLAVYLVMVVLLPCYRGDRSQKVHFFSVTGLLHKQPVRANPGIVASTGQGHHHVHLEFLPKRDSWGDSAEDLNTVLHDLTKPTEPLPRLDIAGKSDPGPGPPLFLVKRASGLSPPLHVADDQERLFS